MIDTFIEETKENLEVMESGLLELEKDPNNEEIIHSIFRAMHTVKGGAGLMGLEEMSNLAHALENVLDKIREKTMELTEDITAQLFKGYDLLQKMIYDGDLHGESIKDQIDEVKKGLNQFNASSGSADGGDKQEASEKKDQGIHFYKIHLSFQPDLFETGTDPAMLLAELQDIGKVHFVIAHKNKIPKLLDLNPHQMYLSWTVFLETTAARQEIDNIFVFVIDENDITITDITKEAAVWFRSDAETKTLLSQFDYFSDEEIETTLKALKEIGEQLEKEKKLSLTKQQADHHKANSQTNVKKETSNTIRVDTEKLETILNDLGELLIAQSRVKDLVLNGINVNDNLRREIINAFADVDKIIRIVQEEVMNTTMIPIGGTFMRFQRMVRDLAKEKGKQVELILTGKETELDKQVIEQITDPLKHLLRNSIDHGIELPEDRIKCEKDPTGMIELSAYHQEGSIIIEVKDDGKGIDEEVVLKKAREKGLVAPDQVLSKQEIYELLFKAGFSTAEKVTDISGRGVGMDVVITNIRNLRGSVHVESEKGVGTTIKIKLPLTLAIIDGMMVKVGQERFIIPLNVIIEFIKATEQQIHVAEGKGILVHLRDEYIPYVGLYELINIESVSKKPTEGILIIIQNNQRKLALLVDDILGQEQVVIKSIKDNMNQVDGVAGATILGDGNVALILDIPSLFKAAKKKMELKEQLV